MTIDRPPVVSVIMAAYNGGALIGDTIASVLSQSHADFELIVVDDASTDDTLSRLRAIDDPRVIVIASEQNGGPVVARNRAFAAARGNFIAGLDQDDICRADRLAVQLAYLDAHPGVVLVSSIVDMLQDGVVLPPWAPFHTTPVLIDWLLHLGNPLTWSSVMFRADAARRLAVFERTDRLYAEDFDLYHRLSAFGAMARIDEPLVTYRIHAGGASKRYTDMMLDNATTVLAEYYAAIFGDGAREAAGLVMRHLSTGDAVRDPAMLLRLNHVLDAVQRHFIATRAPGAQDLAAIMAESSRLWWKVADASVRSGFISLPRALTACPIDRSVSPPTMARMMTSSLIGAGRAVAARFRAAATNSNGTATIPSHR